MIFSDFREYYHHQTTNPLLTTEERLNYVEALNHMEKEKERKKKNKKR